jgi:hypothetical protein
LREVQYVLITVLVEITPKRSTILLLDRHSLQDFSLVDDESIAIVRTLPGQVSDCGFPRVIK